MSKEKLGQKNESQESHNNLSKPDGLNPLGDGKLIIISRDEQDLKNLQNSFEKDGFQINPYNFYCKDFQLSSTEYEDTLDAIEQSAEKLVGTINEKDYILIDLDLMNSNNGDDILTRLYMNASIELIRFLVEKKGEDIKKRIMLFSSFHFSNQDVLKHAHDIPDIKYYLYNRYSFEEDSCLYFTQSNQQKRQDFSSFIQKTFEKNNL